MFRVFKNFLSTVFILSLLFIVLSCETKQGIQFTTESQNFIFEDPEIRLEFDHLMRCKVYLKSAGELFSLTGQSSPPHFIKVNGESVQDFVVDPEKISISNLENNKGSGKRFEINGYATGPSDSEIEKKILVDIYEKYPGVALVRVLYNNVNSTPGLVIDQEVNGAFALDASLINSSYGKHDFWILQGGSYRSRPDWILPVTDTLDCQNYMGRDEANKNAGGGLPVLDVWNKECGFFIGSIREKPTLISLPAKVDENGFLNIGIKYDRNVEFGEDVYRSIPTVIGVHSGDYFNGLKKYSDIMADRGFKMLEINPSDPVYNAVWCGWGLGPDFTQQQMTAMIPTLKEYNFGTVTVDDGWFESYGDFVLKPTIFPGGDADIAQFTQHFHEQGYPVKLWMTAVVGGEKLMKEHPEWFIKDKNGAFVIAVRNAAYLCPALPEVQDYFRYIVDLVINKWDFDGFKMDFEISNAISECYNPDHHHSSLEESFESLPIIYKIISEETRKLKPKAILEMCPCGMFPSFYKMPYYNQPVASDPNSAWQIRHRGKTIKALMGPRTAYYGDHVERFYSKNNFASMVGVGGIPGSKFVAIEKDDGFLGKKYPVWLDPERRKNFELWLKVYKDNRLSSGEYLNLYDIAYDKPETHVIKKDGILYYSFYADDWNGEIAIRGLENKDYIITDYVYDKQVGKMKGNGKLKVNFKNYLLVKAVPEQ